MTLELAYEELRKKIDHGHLRASMETLTAARTHDLAETIRQETQEFPAEIRNRLREEFLGVGPLAAILTDEDITEIVINDRENIWYERDGRWTRLNDQYLSKTTHQNFYHRLCMEAGVFTNIESPRADGRWRQFRICAIQQPLIRQPFQICLRRQRESPWTSSRLLDLGWTDEKYMRTLRQWVQEKKTTLIVGPTGSGKTSVLNALLSEVSSDERTIILEDTDELCLPNDLSTKLLTRVDPNKIMPTICLGDLVRLALRLRPDRIVMGEVRGEEAKDLLMALATGHKGGFGTLHAADAQQALLRLEMLVQLGAPQWDLRAVRRLIQLSVDAIVVVGLENGCRRLLGLAQISSLEDFGFTLDYTRTST